MTKKERRKIFGLNVVTNARQVIKEMFYRGRTMKAEAAGWELVITISPTMYLLTIVKKGKIKDESPNAE